MREISLYLNHIGCVSNYKLSHMIPEGIVVSCVDFCVTDDRNHENNHEEFLVYKKSWRRFKRVITEIQRFDDECCNKNRKKDKVHSL